MDLEQIRGSIYVKIMSDKTRPRQPRSQSAPKVETGEWATIQTAHTLHASRAGWYQTLL